jgi:YfiH family protein
LADPANKVEAIRADVLAGVPHGFGRRGGVSTGAVAGLNVGLGADDAAEAVRETARAPWRPGARLTTVYQVHSGDCVVAGDWDDAHRPHADALVTDRPGVVLGIVTADCAPILLADSAAGVVGAAHAGWKGAFGGVAEATVEAMVALGASRNRIVAAIGPCIAQSSYEVDEGFRARFIAQDETLGRFFATGREGHWQFALEPYVAHRLALAGVEHVESLSRDTYADEEGFFSFRAPRTGEATYGRQFSLIARP